MAFTMHSHSGEFCSHAVDSLEAVVQRAIAVGFRTLGLTEHMPRGHAADLYPEERAAAGAAADAEAVVAGLGTRFEAYVAEAVRLRAAYADRLTILIGFETEWIRGAADDGARVQALLAAHADVPLDYVVGSVHHVATQPIDYDAATYAAAAAGAAAGGAAAATAGGTEATEGKGADGADGPAATEETLFAAYYDDQLAMLQTLRPRVVGHFDLVRLLSADPGRDPATDARLQAAGVWARIRRNLAFVASYGGWLECNTAALRKGLAEPYPGRAIAAEWVRLGGRFTVSDDSHGTAHVATNYRRGLAFLASLGVREVWTLGRGEGGVVETSVTLEEFGASLRVE